VDEAVRAFVVAALIIVLGLLGILGNAEVGASQTQVVVQSVEVESAVADAAPQVSESMPPSLVVFDQALVNDTVTIARVVSTEPGWIAIYADADGQRGSLVGFAPVTTGERYAVAVSLDAGSTSQYLHAVLHVDLGTAGTFELPTPDVAVLHAGQVVSGTFRLTDELPQMLPEAGAALRWPLLVASTAALLFGLGLFLVGADPSARGVPE